MDWNCVNCGRPVEVWYFEHDETGRKIKLDPPRVWHRAFSPYRICNPERVATLSEEAKAFVEERNHNM